jgi:predicted  nucleic acid-binding Zn-ribbon protein
MVVRVEAATPAATPAATSVPLDLRESAERIEKLEARVDTLLKARRQWRDTAAKDATQLELLHRSGTAGRKVSDHLRAELAAVDDERAQLQDEIMKYKYYCYIYMYTGQRQGLVEHDRVREGS